MAAFSPSSPRPATKSPCVKPFVVSHCEGSQNQCKGWWNACVSKTAQWRRPSRRRNGLTIFSFLSRQVCGMNQAFNHLVYLFAKFGALNQRINEIRSNEISGGHSLRF